MNSAGKRKELDKRKLVLLSIVFLMIIAFIISSSGIDNKKAKQFSSKKVEGAAISSQDAVQGIKDAVGDRIESIQEEAKNINVAEVASSSPQVQKVINDIKSLENYPADQAKGLCEKICSSL